MTGLDTNVLVRYITQDDAIQANFADVMITRVNHANGCGETVTFDKAAADFSGSTLLADP